MDSIIRSGSDDIAAHEIKGTQPRIARIRDPRLRLFYFFFAGTLAPLLRASDNPIATACFRLVTFFPELPLLRVPAFRSCMALRTLLDAFFPYFGIRPPSMLRIVVPQPQLHRFP